MFFRTALLCLGSAFLLAQAPSLELDRTSQALGRIAPKIPVTARFEVRNTGTAALVLREVRPSCGCTTALPGRSILAPGERTCLEVTYDPRGDRGEVRREVSLFSNDPLRGQVDLDLSAEVVPSVVLNDYACFLQGLLPGDRVERTVRCASTTGRTLHLLNLPTNSAPYLAAKAGKAGKDLAVTVTLDASRLPVDRTSGKQTVHLATDDPDTPEVSLEVFWAKGEALQASPAKVAFPPAIAGSAPTLALRLKENRGRAFRILGGTASQPCFRLEGLQGPAAREHLLTVCLAAGTEPGLHTGLLTFTTDDPDEKELTLEVMGFITSSGNRKDEGNPSDGSIF